MLIALLFVAGLIAAGWGLFGLFRKRTGAKTIPVLLLIGGLVLAALAGSIGWYFFRTLSSAQVYSYTG